MALNARRLAIPEPPLSDSAIIATHVELHPDDLNFNAGTGVTLAANAVRQTVVSFRVPRGFLGILRTLANQVDNVGDWANITWSLTKNKVPVPGFANFTGQIAQVLSPFSSLRLVIPLEKNCLVEIVATNLSAADILNVTAILRGHVFQDEVRP